MTKYKYVNKPVCFNLDDPDQNRLFEHATKRHNFSAYIKRLIQRDMEIEVKSQTDEEPSDDLDEGLLNNFI